MFGIEVDGAKMLQVPIYPTPPARARNRSKSLAIIRIFDQLKSPKSPSDCEEDDDDFHTEIRRSASFSVIDEDGRYTFYML